MTDTHKEAKQDSKSELARLARPPIVLSDFDGTLTHHTDFSSQFLDILDFLSSHNTPLVIVTGRSVSWGHFLLTHFSSLNHVIAEGGGIHTYKHSDGTIVQELMVEREAPKKLQQISEELKEQFPNLTLSADSIGRVTDRAIELDMLENQPETFHAVKNYLTQAGAHYSTSNVHLNFWCGNFNKMTSIRTFMKKFAPTVNLEECVFFGDSLNDQSVFEALPGSIGVANLQEVEARMEHKPAIILRDPAHSGPAGVLFALHQLFNSGKV